MKRFRDFNFNRDLRVDCSNADYAAVNSCLDLFCSLSGAFWEQILGSKLFMIWQAILIHRKGINHGIEHTSFAMKFYRAIYQFLHSWCVEHDHIWSSHCGYNYHQHKPLQTAICGCYNISYLIKAFQTVIEVRHRCLRRDNWRHGMVTLTMAS